MQTTASAAVQNRRDQRSAEQGWAITLARTELALWDVLLDHPVLGPNIHAAAAGVRGSETGELTAEAVRDLDPDRALLDVVLDELSALPPQRELLRRVSELNATALAMRHAIARANTGLVATVAREFDFGIIPLPDLIQEGHVGLLKAIGRFDPDRGVRFSTYAVWWIRHTVRRSLSDKGRLVRLPVNVVNGGYQINKTRRALTAELGRAPTLEELAAATDFTVERLRQLERAVAQRAESLDAPTDDYDRREQRHNDPVDDEPRPDEVAEKRHTIARMHALLGTLSSVEADVLRRRYGLNGHEIETLSQIGDAYGLSRERIRQIQQQALARLRRSF